MTEKDEKPIKTKTEQKLTKTKQDEHDNPDYAIARVRESNLGQKVVTVPRYCENIQSGHYVKITKVEDNNKKESVKVENDDNSRNEK